jgi:hypothetical protein
MAENNDHIKTLRLFDLSFEAAAATELEKQHLRRCEQCRDVLAAFTRQFGKRPNDKPEDAA